jgi:hypothetical protein
LPKPEELPPVFQIQTQTKGRPPGGKGQTRGKIQQHQGGNNHLNLKLIQIQLHIEQGYNLKMKFNLNMIIIWFIIFTLTHCAVLKINKEDHNWIQEDWQLSNRRSLSPHPNSIKSLKGH